jgi:selenoprotein W-related protein
VLEEFEHQLDEVVLIPSRGGVFEVMLGDELLFSKKETGRHAEFDDVLKSLRTRLSS